MRRVQIVYFLFLLSLTFQACNSDDDENMHEIEWQKMEFPDKGSIYSIYGSLEDRLLLGTSQAIIMLTENGKVSREVLKLDGAIRGFEKLNDTLYAFAIFKSHYSVDEGETWKESAKAFTPPSSQWKFRDSKGMLYYHVALSNGELVTPSLILRSIDNGTNWENIFPFKHYVYSMYIDSNDRLYLGINGWQWDGLSFSGNSTTAILYYTKK